MSDKPRMAPHPEAPAGLEQDNKGNPIPFEKRTEEDQEKGSPDDRGRHCA